MEFFHSLGIHDARACLHSGIYRSGVGGYRKWQATADGSTSLSHAVLHRRQHCDDDYHICIVWWTVSGAAVPAKSTRAERLRCRSADVATSTRLNGGLPDRGAAGG